MRRAGRQGSEARKETEAGPPGMGSEEIPDHRRDKVSRGTNTEETQTMKLTGKHKRVKAVNHMGDWTI